MFSTFCSTPNERLVLFTTIFSIQSLKFHLGARLTKQKAQTTTKRRKIYLFDKINNNFHCKKIFFTYLCMTFLYNRHYE